MPDHLHLLVSPKPHISISNIVRDIKRDSYFWIIENGFCGDEFGWQDGFGAIYSRLAKNITKKLILSKNGKICNPFPN